MRNFKEVCDEAFQIEVDDRDKVLMFEGIEQMVHNEWDLPEEIKLQADWCRPVPSTDPYDAVRAGSNIMSGREPIVRFLPMAPNEPSKRLANDMERVLKSWYNLASRRRPIPLTADITYSAFMYGMVCAQVVYLPYQERIAKKLGIGGDPKRWKMAQQYGPFVVNLYNPKNVYTRHSDLMLEKVLAVQEQSIDDVISYWGMNDELRELMSKLSSAPSQRRVLVYDYTDISEKCVFITLESRGDPIKLNHEEMDLPFFPWVARFGGTSLETEAEYRVKPLLAPLYKTGLYDTLCVAKSLAVSDMIVRAAQPRGMKEGPDPDSIEKEYLDPGGDIKVPAGHKYTPLPPEPIDTGMLTVVDGINNDVVKTTIPKMMQDPNVPNNINFATLNSSIQMGLTVIKPFSVLAELAISDVMTLMTRWFVHNGKSAVVLGTTKRDTGKQYLVDPKTINVDNLLITVELTPDVPTDKLQRINGAGLAVEKLNLPKEDGLSDIGVEDPQYAIEQSAKERLFEAQVQAQMLQIQAETQLMIDKAKMEMQMQGQLAMQNAQMQMQSRAMGGAPQGEPSAGPLGPSDQIPQGGPPPQGGNELNGTGNGAIPPQMFDPSATREAVTGATQGGEAVAGA